MITHMSKVTKEDIIRLAKLSKIALEENEIAKFQSEIESILTHIEQLQKIDTENVEPTYQVTGLHNVSRADEVSDYGVSKEELLKNAADKKDGMIKVPKVL